MARATNPIQIVAGFKVRSPAGMDQFITRVSQAIRMEARLPANARFPSLANLQQQARRVPKADTVKLAGLFAKLRDYASSNRAPQTAAAIVQAASWFYYNVEGGRRAAAPAAPAVVRKGARAVPETNPLVRAFDEHSRARTASSGSSKPDGDLPLTQRVWFWPAVVGSVGILAATGILFIGRK